MAGEKVMIVDDDKEFLEELAGTLYSSGYDVVSVNNATLATNVAYRTKPDIILLDLKMPKKTGFQIADELNRFSELREIPVIAMTGYPVAEEHSSSSNIKACLKKPFDTLEVINKIEEELIVR